MSTVYRHCETDEIVFPCDVRFTRNFVLICDRSTGVPQDVTLTHQEFDNQYDELEYCDKPRKNQLAKKWSADQAFLNNICRRR